jgi:hypothetical protein
MSPIGTNIFNFQILTENTVTKPFSKPFQKTMAEKKEEICAKYLCEEAPAHLVPPDITHDDWIECFNRQCCGLWFHAVCMGITYKFAPKLATNNASGAAQRVWPVCNFIKRRYQRI